MGCCVNSGTQTSSQPETTDSNVEKEIKNSTLTKTSENTTKTDHVPQNNSNNPYGGEELKLYRRESDIKLEGINELSKEDEKPLNFEQIKEIIKNKQFELFKRTVEDEKYFLDEIKKRIKKYHSRNDQILILEFKCKTKTNPESNKLEAIIDDTTPKQIFVDNLFPYNIESDIQHYLLWSLDNLTEKLGNDKIQKLLEDEYINTDVYDFIWYENPGSKKSFPGLWHIQIFMNPK